MAAGIVLFVFGGLAMFAGFLVGVMSSEATGRSDPTGGVIVVGGLIVIALGHCCQFLDKICRHLEYQIILDKHWHGQDGAAAKPAPPAQARTDRQARDRYKID